MTYNVIVINVLYLEYSDDIPRIIQSLIYRTVNKDDNNVIALM